jgi:hypothetical protein
MQNPTKANGIEIVPASHNEHKLKIQPSANGPISPCLESVNNA